MKRYRFQYNHGNQAVGYVLRVDAESFKDAMASFRKDEGVYAKIESVAVVLPTGNEQPITLGDV